MIGSLSVFLIFKNIDPKEFFEYFERSSLPRMFFLFLLFSFSILIDALRMKMVYHFTWRKRLSLFDAFFNNYMGFFFSMVTPFAFGGQVYQVYHLSKLGLESEHNVNVITSRFVEYLILSFLLSLHGFMKYKDVVFTTRLVTPKLMISAYFLSLLFVGIVVISLIYPRWIAILLTFFKRIRAFDKLLRKATKRENWDERFLAWTDEMKKSVKTLWSNGVMLLDIPLTLASLLVQGLVFQLSLSGVSKVGFLEAVGILYFLNLIVFYVPTPGASGGVEAIHQITLTKVFGKAGMVLAAVVTWRIATFYLPMIFGVLFLAFYRYPKEARR